MTIDQPDLLTAPRTVPMRRWDDVPNGVPPKQASLSQGVRIQVFLVLAAAGALTMGASAALLQQHQLLEGGAGLLVSLFLFARGFPLAGRRDRRRTDPKEGQV
jgi:hypothetical protein